jgi:hypothetical protein
VLPAQYRFFCSFEAVKQHLEAQAERALRFNSAPDLSKPVTEKLGGRAAELALEWLSP